MIVFLGLSHLSLSYAASLINLNKKVVILDFDKEIKNYNLGKNKVFEPGLDKILNNKINYLKITSNFKILRSAKIIFLAKDIKTKNNNTIILKETADLLKQTSNI